MFGRVVPCLASSSVVVYLVDNFVSRVTSVFDCVEVELSEIQSE